jgi:hypothetical protein
MTISIAAKIYRLGISTIFTMGLFGLILPSNANPVIHQTQIKPISADPIKPILNSVVPESLNPSNSKIVNAIGIIKYTAGCLGLIGDDGSHYELRGNYPEHIGAKVQITGLVSTTETVTTCQVGIPVYVQTFSVISYPHGPDRWR